MEAKQAIQTAKGYLTEVFNDEGIANVRLEEIEFDDYSNEWRITIGFQRTFKSASLVLNALVSPSEERFYKVIRIEDRTGKVLSLKDRLLPVSD